MSQPLIGEIRIFAGNFAPAGWAFCNGQLLAISENDALFTLIGTTYGGDGEETFALPNLQSRTPVHINSTGYPLAQMAGQESVTLTTQQIPVHTHPWLAGDVAASALVPTNNVPAEATKRFYVDTTPTTAMAATAITPVGGSQPHENMQPYLVLNFIISLYGEFPQAT